MTRFALITLTVLYPFLIYVGLTRLSPGLVALLLGVLFVLRGAAARGAAAHGGDRLLVVVPAMGVTAYSLVALIGNSAILLKFYPVVISTIMLAVFAFSLFRPPPMIERIVRMRGITISENGRHYLRNLTAIWCGFFLVNGAIAAWTTAQSHEIWLLYNGLVSYLLVALLIGIELIYRRHYRRRAGVQLRP